MQGFQTNMSRNHKVRLIRALKQGQCLTMPSTLKALAIPA